MTGGAHVLSAEECRTLLSAARIGRIAYVDDHGIQVLPVNYQPAGSELIIRTAEDGPIAAVVAQDGPFGFQVDHHDSVTGTAWSVLMNGTLRVIPATDDAIPAPTDGPRPWAPGPRALVLGFHPEWTTGRRVRRAH